MSWQKTKSREAVGGCVKAGRFGGSSGCLRCSCPAVRVNEVHLSSAFALLPTQHLCSEPSAGTTAIEHWYHSHCCTGLLPCACEHPYPSCRGRHYSPPRGRELCIPNHFALVGRFHCKITPRGRICPLETGVMPRRVCWSPTAGVGCGASTEGGCDRERSGLLAADPLRHSRGPGPGTAPGPASRSSGARPRAGLPRAGSIYLQPPWPARKSSCWQDINIYL